MTRIRTRFAPSPTGFIHLGNIRSALYPWAFARATGGDFILRIEDTDLERSSQAAVDVIIEGMAWLGLDHDEGPFYQMQRMDRYKEVIGQMLAAGIVVLNGVKVYWIPLPNTIITLDDAMSILLTMALIFLCVNSINLIDGLDGLAAGVVAIGASSFFVYAYWLSYEQELVRATTASLITVVTVGMCLGFLPYNVHPARMFMGDSGSMLLGFLMATSMISLTGQIDPSQVTVQGSGLAVNAYLPLFLPLAVMALPLGDLLLAYVRRTMAGRLWFQADKQHLHHRMLDLGHSHGRAVLLLWLWTAVLAFGAILIGLTTAPWAIAALLAGLALAAWLTWKPVRRAA